ncbi:YeiH family protein [Phenylobacterium montanum]|uniref:YeiH family putative sulfate export transporter n=1 Tax=Phenylobacterium montanum TaxID=2823693 RepID=A0A975FZP2_9CAUL|nr:YeiH family protein [Caulobacter sp. S6]QUD87909.1 YeiH family putative sulfate export transporter [Caulobacter sp. S6]
MTYPRLASHSRPAPDLGRWSALLPGLALCGAVTVAAFGLQALEIRLFGRAWLEALVIAILLGAAVRTAWTPGQRFLPGVAFSAKMLLEVAVVLLGATISASTIFGQGPALLVSIAGLVVLAICVSYGLGRLFGLPHKMATLIACGNSICGNSAIAAVAPVIGAESEDVAASIAFTAVLGVVVVLILPLLAVALHMSPRGFGVFAGLTVYAVPQVLAATAPISSFSAQVGAVVKLVRVLMLGPVVLVLSLLHGQEQADATKRGPNLQHLVPWFILGFLLMVALRSAGMLPAPAVKAAGGLATWLTILSMAALGLGVDVRTVAKAGPRVTAVVTLSLMALGAVALLLIYSLKLG